jgi:copper chaperone
MINLQVKGMSCNHCAMAVTRAVHGVDPQAKVEIDLPSGRVAVDAQGTPQAIADAITDAGYEVLSTAD